MTPVQHTSTSFTVLNCTRLSNTRLISHFYNYSSQRPTIRKPCRVPEDAMANQLFEASMCNYVHVRFAASWWSPPNHCCTVYRMTPYTPRLFWAGNEFAPDLKIDEIPAQDFLQDHYIGALTKLATYLRDLPNVIGYGTLNEPSPGLSLFSLIICNPFAKNYGDGCFKVLVRGFWILNPTHHYGQGTSTGPTCLCWKQILRMGNEIDFQLFLFPINSNAIVHHTYETFTHTSLVLCAALTNQWCLHLLQSITCNTASSSCSLYYIQLTWTSFHFLHHSF